MRIHALGRPVLCVRPPRGLAARPGLAISEGGPFYPVRMRYRRSCLDRPACVAYTQCFTALRDKRSECGSLCGVFRFEIGSLL